MASYSHFHSYCGPALVDLDVEQQSASEEVIELNNDELIAESLNVSNPSYDGSFIWKEAVIKEMKNRRNSDTLFD